MPFITAPDVHLSTPTSSSSEPLEYERVKIVCMSDTHTQHGDVESVPHGDIFVHSGDFLFREHRWWSRREKREREQEQEATGPITQERLFELIGER